MPEMPLYRDDVELADLETTLWQLFALNSTIEADKARLSTLCQCMFLSGYVKGKETELGKLSTTA